MQWPDVWCMSICLSVNIGHTNLDVKIYGVHTWSVDTLGDWLLPILELCHSNLLCGIFTFSMYFNGKKICIKWLLTTTCFSICQMIVHTKTFVLYEQFDLFSRSQKPSEFGRFVFYELIVVCLCSVYTNMGWPRLLWPIRSPEVKTFLIRIQSCKFGH